MEKIKSEFVPAVCEVMYCYVFRYLVIFLEKRILQNFLDDHVRKFEKS